MTTLHTLLVNLHIAVGAVALVSFWIPAIANKGSALHARAGRFYVAVMYAVSATALGASLLVLVDPVGIRRPGLDLEAEELAELAGQFRAGAMFLTMLAVLVFTSIRHGIAALRTRQEPDALRKPAHRGLIALLGVMGAGIAATGAARGLLLLLVFGSIAVLAASSMYRRTRIVRLSTAERTIAHFSGMIGSGIGAYTAFFAFGGSRLFGDILSGHWQVVSWLLAPVIGTVVISRLARRYGRRAAPDKGTSVDLYSTGPR